MSGGVDLVVLAHEGVDYSFREMLVRRRISQVVGDDGLPDSCP